ncbi:conserved hypothetical protein [Solidesulfovibrio fructosivorans JJ]]|uniref:AB hydrolase-1 domain-containing protein n=1 Tax=Solidesulfovibrio fructosivorans JJ] TaxID=596151 RepID=E1JX77_SOLFR|nr:alpha/beta fold hydrolase [Solidesulfovibrio fructosivorans]EFL51042.1 conserved hypothetical protein [Solidesulfovibrio fructosivorans JJ]]
MTLVVWLFVVVFLVSAAVTGLTTVFSLCAAARPGAPEFLSRPCRHRRVACRLYGLATGMVSQCVMILTYPLGPLVGRAPRPASDPDAPTVVCLHGLYHNAAAFLLLRPVLARYGLRRALCLSYRSLGTDFETTAKELLARVRREAPGEGPLLFLGHSLGGLMARRLMAEPDIARRTRAAVTLGAPHRGSALAVLALGRLGRGLVPESPLFQTIAAWADPPDAALLSLASPVDNMVMPLSGLVVGRAGWVEEACPPVSHVAMLYAPAVARRAASFLAGAAGVCR